MSIAASRLRVTTMVRFFMTPPSGLQLGEPFQDQRPLVRGEGSEGDGLVLGAGPLLVDAAHQAPAPRHVPGLAGGQVIAGEVDDPLRPLIPPAPQQGQAELPAHEPADLQRDFGSADPRPPLDESVPQVLVVRVLGPVGAPEIAQGQAFGRGPALADALGPPRQDLQVPDLRDERDLPAVRDPGPAVEGEARVEVGRRRLDDLGQPDLGPEPLDRLDGPDAHAAALGGGPILALAPGGQEIAGPAVQVDAVDEILRALGRLAEVLGRRIVGIGDRAFAVLVVDGVLAPDVPLANADPLLLGQILLVGRGQEAGDHALGPEAAAHDLRDAGQAVVEIAVDLVPRVVGVGEVGPGDERHVVAEPVAELGHEGPDAAVVLALVEQGPPAEGPGHRRAGPAGGEGVAERPDVLGRVAVGFVEALVLRPGDLDLVDADDGIEGQDPPPVEGFAAPRRGRPAGRGPGPGRAPAASSPAPAFFMNSRLSMALSAPRASTHTWRPARS
ncbi:MAG: hypothetical protein MZV63_58995 [Marinilabiliales bacterium]|nr:hypothetical protein [Marinilabiliales bacterium]